VLVSRCALCALCALLSTLVVEFSYLREPVLGVVDPSQTMREEFGAAVVLTVIAAGIALLGCVTAWMPSVTRAQIGRAGRARAYRRHRLSA